VNNAIGDKVEIMICDVQSYLIAMHYMLAFNPAERLITYWDEPTITMDYETHDLHSIIHQNWKENQIPNVVLSCATLPHEEEIQDTLADFRARFDAEIHTIQSYDCRKSIPMLTKDGFCAMPHTLYDLYEELAECVRHCTKNKTMLRYFDLNEIVRFLFYVNEKEFVPERFQMKNYFADIADITMNSLKIYYLEVLQRLKKDDWPQIHTYMKTVQKPKFSPSGSFTKAHSVDSVFDKNASSGGLLKRTQSIGSIATTTTKPATSGVLITTADAYTLTDGPTIFISDDVEKIAKFCIQQANIPAVVMEDLSKKIEFNNVINEKLFGLESECELIKEQNEQQAKNSISSFHNGSTICGRNKSNKDTKKASRDTPEEMENKGKLNRLIQDITSLRSMIKPAILNDIFIPNNKLHLEKWAQNIDSKGAFTSNVDEQTVCDIMALNGIENSWKVLLMMGIGVFINHENIAYTEIMKKLADEQKLYMIIASSDYIYGTNYQFCHGYLSKNLSITQEKIIQALNLCLMRSIGKKTRGFLIRLRRERILYSTKCLAMIQL
jgi:hypothetical protein